MRLGSVADIGDLYLVNWDDNPVFNRQRDYLQSSSPLQNFYRLL